MRGLLVGLLAGCAVLGVVESAAAQEPVYCAGAQATIVGTEGDDVIVGTDGADVIAALTGNDRIQAGAGADVICAGPDESALPDADIVDAGPGDDLVRTGAGDDRVVLGAGSDHADTGSGSDSVRGNDGDDYIDSGADADSVDGGPGADFVAAGDGHDVVTSSGAGADYLDGGPGYDQLTGSIETSYIDGGSGNDRIVGDAGYLVGGDGDDVVTGRGAVTYVDAGGGGDLVESVGYVDGGAGDDALTATGTDGYLEGGEGDDVLTSGTGGNTTLDGGNGADQLDSAAAADVLIGGDGPDILDGGGGNDTLLGGAGDDLLRGRGGRDALTGDSGADVLIGGPDPDAFDGGAGTDVLRAVDDGPDLSFACGAVFENDLLIVDAVADAEVERSHCEKERPRTVVVSPPPRPLVGARYVALGDSFSSGEGTYVYDSGGGVLCHRGSLGWPRRFGREYLLLDDDAIDHRACSGALSLHFRSSWVARAAKPQIHERPQTRTELVTFTIGGNDVGFEQLLQAIRATPNDVRSPATRRVETERRFNAALSVLLLQLRMIYPDLRKTYPNARIVHVGYPRFLPSIDEKPHRCAWLGKKERDLGDWMLFRLNDTLRATAERSSHDIEFADVTDALEGHELCTRNESWVNDLAIEFADLPSIGGGSTERGHPNLWGQVAYADAVADALYGDD